jgi:hypothetical protein
LALRPLWAYSPQNLRRIEGFFASPSSNDTEKPTNPRLCPGKGETGVVAFK